MTIAMGINFGTYVLLAADTRVALSNGDRSTTPYYKDDYVKIHETTMGLITGVGIRKLLSQVEGRLQKEKVTDTDQILNIIKEEKLHYQRLFSETNEQYIERIKQEIELTSWIFSYGTGGNRNPKLKLGIIHPTVGDDLVICQENVPTVIWPFGVTEEIATSISDVLKRNIKPFNQFGTFSERTLSESIGYNSTIIAAMMRTMHLEFPSISPSFRIGVHTLYGSMGISSIMKETDTSVSITLKNHTIEGTD